MADLNKVFLMGRLTQDPELRYTPSGAAVSDLRLATSRTWQGKDGERREETLYIDVTVWNRQAENCCQYLKKGRAVHVEGYLKMDSWDDKTSGEKRTKVKVEADRVQFLDRKDDPGGGGGAPMGEDDDEAPRDRDRGGSTARRPNAPSDARPPAGGGNSGRGGFVPPTAPGPRRPPAPPADSDDDDIPF